MFAWNQGAFHMFFPSMRAKGVFASHCSPLCCSHTQCLWRLALAYTDETFDCLFLRGNAWKFWKVIGISTQGTIYAFIYFASLPVGCSFSLFYKGYLSKTCRNRTPCSRTCPTCHLHARPSVWGLSPQVKLCQDSLSCSHPSVGLLTPFLDFFQDAKKSSMRI